MATSFKANPLLGGRLQKGPSSRYQVDYEAFGETDPVAVEAAARTHFASSYDGMPLQEVIVNEFGADDEWKVTLLYAPDGYSSGSYTAPPETGQSLYFFDTGGGSQHITQNIETSQTKVPPGETEPDYKGAIGVTNGSVNGIDITVPAYQFKITQYMDAATVDSAYRKAVASLTGSVNDEPFRDFNAQEVLFLGATGSYREDDDDWEITFRFAQSDNRTGIEIGSITGIVKKGWEYLEVHYEEELDDNAGVLVANPVSVVVNKVYEAKDFTQLQIV